MKNAPYSVCITKHWRAAGDSPCEFCAGMEGVEAGILDVGLKESKLVEILRAQDNNPGADIIAHGYADGTLPDAHEGCECVFVWEFEPKSLDEARAEYKKRHHLKWRWL